MEALHHKQEEDVQHFAFCPLQVDRNSQQLIAREISPNWWFDWVCEY